MAKFGCPPRFIAMVRQFHDGIQARLQSDGEFSEPFEVTNGVKQGCVTASTMLSMMFSAMLIDAFQDNDTDTVLMARLQANTQVQTDVLDELLYADDMDKHASPECKNANSHGSSLTVVITMISTKNRGCTLTSTWKAIQ